MVHFSGCRLVYGVFQTATVSSLFECLLQCNNNIYCAATNYREGDSLQEIEEKATKNCELVEVSDGKEPILVKDDRYKVYSVLAEFTEVHIIMKRNMFY